MHVAMNPERVRSLREEKGMSRKGLAEADDGERLRLVYARTWGRLYARA